MSDVRARVIPLLSSFGHHRVWTVTQFSRRLGVDLKTGRELVRELLDDGTIVEVDLSQHPELRVDRRVAYYRTWVPQIIIR